MQFGKLLVAVAVLATCLAAQQANDEKAFTTIWKPTESQVLEFNLTADFTAGPAKFTMMGDMTQKVTKIATNGDYTLETTYSHGRIVTQGEEQKLEDGDMKPKIEKYNAKGEVIEHDKGDTDDDDAPTAALDQAGYIAPPEKPVKKGDKWSYKFPAEKNKPAAKSDYEVLGVEKLGPFEVVKIKVSFKQTEGSQPVTAEGTVSLDVKDQSIVKEEFLVDNMGLSDSDKGQMKMVEIRKEAASAG